MHDKVSRKKLPCIQDFFFFFFFFARLPCMLAAVCLSGLNLHFRFNHLRFNFRTSNEMSQVINMKGERDRGDISVQV